MKTLHHALFALFFVSMPAAAQQIDMPSFEDLPNDVKPRHVDFTDITNVSASVDKPDLKMSSFRTPAQFNSLIKLRSDFSSDIQFSVNRVR